MAMRFHVAEYGAWQCEHRTACLNLQRRVSNNTRAEPTRSVRPHVIAVGVCSRGGGDVLCLNDGAPGLCVEVVHRHIGNQ